MSNHGHYPQQGRPLGQGQPSSSRPGLTRQGSSSAFHPSAATHLRQRSNASPRTPTFPRQPPSNENHNPFDDRHGPAPVPMPVYPPQPTPHRAALLQTPIQTSFPSNNDSTADVAKEQAMLMRGQKNEWTPTQQRLHGDVFPVAGAAGGAATGAAAGFFTLTSPDTSPLSDHIERFGVPFAPDDFAFVSNTYPEDDDDLHDPGPMNLRKEGLDHRIIEPRAYKRGQGLLSFTGFLNLLAIIAIFLALIFTFAGLPIWQWVVQLETPTYGAAGLGGVNGSGQVPDVPSYRGLIDKDTPDEALTKKGFFGKELKLVFSDEFNDEGRLFYPGMDPYWEAVDLHYWQTNNLEWYDPDMVYTEGGFLTLEVNSASEADSHGFGYLGGMLQSWNQLCFVGGYVEVAVSLPGSVEVSGLWPAAWLMSNLGRAGYGGSLDGTWPYVYDTCDVGTLPNQTNPDGTPQQPMAAGDVGNNGDLSHLKGQRFSRCTCSGETDHPGPQYSNGTWKGRGASEIDIFEATVNAKQGYGEVSQSAQWAPMNPYYSIDNSSTDYVDFFDTDYQTIHNTYLGGATQQVTSGLSHTDPTTYDSTTTFMKYGVEWVPSERDGLGTGKMAWTQNDDEMWFITDTAMGANDAAQIGPRVVTAEPMYLLLNLGMSENFGDVDLQNLVFPAKMRVDYVRVYQDKDHVSVGCDPKENPTVDHIKRNAELYQNPSITVYADADRVFPKNSLVDTC
ncbi:hypothetical protein JCM10207_006570 [Rhodosporidiobolus poonsookiae]